MIWWSPKECFPVGKLAGKAGLMGPARDELDIKHDVKRRQRQRASSRATRNIRDCPNPDHSNPPEPERS